MKRARVEHSLEALQLLPTRRVAIPVLVRDGKPCDRITALDLEATLRSGLSLPLCAYSPLLHPAYGPEHAGLPQQHPGVQQLAHMYHWSWYKYCYRYRYKYCYCYSYRYKSVTVTAAAAAAAALGPGGPYHVPHGVPQFSGAVGGFCNGGIGNVGDLPSYQETVRGGGAAAWYGNPEPRYPTSKSRSEPKFKNEPNRPNLPNRQL
ncbi:Homeobox protein Nkx-2.2a [Nibea albiflora]|uniref:Homeobox protein Nkx-2.2a n=1 Tax=Nibea albiflora TaxID=240163 RepID=A0ACB7FAN5_NIBAL|nr:Homeobox protein Nkx-2.2a [Nibea albiflora]